MAMLSNAQLMQQRMAEVARGPVDPQPRINLPYRDLRPAAIAALQELKAEEEYLVKPRDYKKLRIGRIVFINRT